MNKIDLRSGTQLLTLLIFALFSTTLLIKELGATALGQEAIGQANRDLFIPLEGVQGAQVVPPQADKRIVIERSRVVQLNWEHLPSIDRLSAALLPTTANDQLQLNLFTDLTLTALLNQIESNPSGGGYVWSGVVEGVPNSLVQLVVNEQLMAGDIRLPDRQGAEGLIAGAIYQVRPTTDGLYTVRQLRMVAPLPSAKDYARPLIERPTAALAEAGNVAGAQTDDDSTIDVMVAYTPLVRNTVGGAAALAMEIDLAVSLTNQAGCNFQTVS